MMSMGWTWYVIALVALNIFGCVWLLWWTGRRRPGDPKPEDTLHTWDGDLKEYNKPLPRWWINLFYLTIIFSIGYLFWYGGLGRIPGYSKWNSQNEHAADKAVEDAKLEQTFKPYAGQPIDVLAQDPKALALGRSIFGNTCATCHGSTGQGATGYPNLTDDIWHWGGSPDRILETVLDGREGVMPEWGTVLTGMGGPEAVDYTIAYVRTLSAPETLKNNFMAAQGEEAVRGRLRGLPRHRRQGQPGPGRARPERRLLDVRQQPRKPAQDDHGRPPRQHARAPRIAGRNPRPPGRRICLVVVA